ncbi:hypothetical protein FACS1894141_6910 [Spirochaetia bacterium]|nr:hypothetical protein FACS1894141_6910 [Spirochaetia bacterium]
MLATEFISENIPVSSSVVYAFNTKRFAELINQNINEAGTKGNPYFNNLFKQ